MCSFSSQCLTANLTIAIDDVTGLFQGAILLGSSALSPSALQQHPEDIRQQMAAVAGCWDPISDANAAHYDLAPCLRKLTLQQLLEKSNLSSPRFTPSFAPFVDGGQSTSALRDLIRLKGQTSSDCDLLVISTMEPSPV